MNITANSSMINTNFGCNDQNCNGHCQQAQIVSTQPTQDVVEISTGKKVKNACKKSVKFVKENKNGIMATAKATLEGVLTACTILGANVLMQKVCKSDTSALATKLAVIGGVAVGGTQLIKDRKAFQKGTPQAK